MPSSPWPGGNTPGNSGSIQHNPPPNFGSGGMSLPLTQDLTFDPDWTYSIGSASDLRPWKIFACGDIITEGGMYSTFLSVNGQIQNNDLIQTSSGIVPGNGTAMSPAALYSGSGEPSAGLGSVGAYYFRVDTPGTTSQRIYVKTAPTTWMAIV